MGAAEAAANLLCEFKIAEKNEAKLTKNKNGKLFWLNLLLTPFFRYHQQNLGQ